MNENCMDKFKLTPEEQEQLRKSLGITLREQELQEQLAAKTKECEKLSTNQTLDTSLLAGNKAELTQLRLTNERMAEALKNLIQDDSSYPLDEVANVLVEASQILLNDKSYDGDKHERIAIARNHGTLIPTAVRFAREALSTHNSTDTWAAVVKMYEALRVLLATYLDLNGCYPLPHNKDRKACNDASEALNLAREKLGFK